MLWYKTRFSTSWEGVIQTVANLAKLLGESAVDEQDRCRDSSPGKFAASSRTGSRNFSHWITGSKQHLGRYFPKEQLPDARWVLCNFIQSSWWGEEIPPWKCSEISPMITLVWGLTGPPATPEGCWAPWVSQCPVTVARPTWLHLYAKPQGSQMVLLGRGHPCTPLGSDDPLGLGHASSWCTESPPTTRPNLSHVNPYF